MERTKSEDLIDARQQQKLPPRLSRGQQIEEKGTTPLGGTEPYWENESASDTTTPWLPPPRHKGTGEGENPSAIATFISSYIYYQFKHI